MSIMPETPVGGLVGAGGLPTTEDAGGWAGAPKCPFGSLVRRVFDWTFLRFCPWLCPSS